MPTYHFLDTHQLVVHTFGFITKYSFEKMYKLLDCFGYKEYVQDSIWRILLPHGKPGGERSKSYNFNRCNVGLNLRKRILIVYNNSSCRDGDCFQFPLRPPIYILI